MACVLLAGCGESVPATVIAPGANFGGFTPELGDVVEVRTAGLLEPEGALFLEVAGAELRAEQQVARLPLEVREVHVVSTQATVHRDAAARDRGQVLLPFGRALSVAAGPMPGEQGGLLLVEGGRPVGFVRGSDVQDRPPNASDMLRIAKDALREGAIDKAGGFAEAALRADPTHVGASRLVGALGIRGGEPEGFRMWLEHMPPAPQAVDLPPPTPVVGSGQAFVYATDVSLRSRPDARSARRALLDAGRVVDVHRVADGWAEVTVQPVAGSVLTAAIPSDPGATLQPWKEAHAMTVRASRGHVAASLLSATPPEVDSLLEIGLARAASGDPMGAIVPLSRVLAVDPAHREARSALLAAAVEAEHFNIALHALDLDTTSREASAPGVTIDRISGCHGERKAARERVLPSEGVVREPKYSITDFTPGVLAVDTVGEAACVVDDEPYGVLPFHQVLLDLESYVHEELLDDPCWGGDSEITPDQRRAYDEYVARRTPELAEQAQIHHDYVVAYQQWDSARSELLSGPQIRVAITAATDLPVGAIGVYSFRWRAVAWCGDLHEAEREGLELRRMSHPAIPAGQTLELWITDVDLTQAWGVVLAQDLARLDEDMRAIQEETASRAGSGDMDFDRLPEELVGRVFETSHGLSANIVHDCCGC